MPRRPPAARGKATANAIWWHFVTWGRRSDAAPARARACQSGGRRLVHELEAVDARDGARVAHAVSVHLWDHSRMETKMDTGG